ncbi:hypothetical protein [Okeania sp.]|uniref:WD40 domain-containing protein n=1 Tax=Okeania sp. TaxID=3100323 RepID=UPI002B4AB4B7|nr:hypothetical protein [Okeania sp.]MEB3340390.1 hypothetical protein [Okeania sp.]
MKDLEESIVYNRRSLKRLIRSLTISQGQFSLVLVGCNYEYLQQIMMAEVRKLSSVELQEMALPTTVNSLYRTIDEQLERFPNSAAVMVFDLRKVERVDELLISTNQVRDEFRKKFNFPLVLWVTDGLLAKLIRLAPDFKSWAAATIKFELGTSDLIHLLRLEVESYWVSESANQKQCLIPLVDQSVMLLPYSSEGLSNSKREEIGLALEDLKGRGENLEPILAANIEFLLGRDDYHNEEINSAIDHYQRCLSLWRYEVREQCYLYQPEFPQLPVISKTFILEQQGIVLYNIALCYCLLSTQNILDNSQELERAKLILLEAKQLFEKVNSFTLVAEVTTTLGGVVKQMRCWQELEDLALAGIELHQKYGNELQVAQDYGFLAEVALQRLNWSAAQRLSEKALNILFYAKDVILPTAKNKYLLLLAKSLKNLYRQVEAIEYLEIAEATEKQAVENSLKFQKNRDPKLYIEILTELRSLYYEQGRYLEAFRLKRASREVAHQYGLLAFIGASQLQPQRGVGEWGSGGEVEMWRRGDSGMGSVKSVSAFYNLPVEITASSRQEDINNLVERVCRDDYKLTIIHGRSGVGKSSLVNAGLIPALSNMSISARDTMILVVQTYKDWLGTLGSSLEKALQKRGYYGYQSPVNGCQSSQELGSHNRVPLRSEAEKIIPYLSDITEEFNSRESSILEQVKRNGENSLLTVIVFDQLEEFFFISNGSVEREAFYRFICDCLNMPFVKMIFSMREDYLHYLLECDFIGYLDVINNNILDKQIRYHVRDFSKKDAYNVIECLTRRSCFNLEPQLINAIVEGLADEREQVRPIELQVVGSQLQEEKPPIKTLEHFQQKFGINPKKAKARLIKKFLEQVIIDCGEENEEATMQVLYALTNENLTRASRTEKELLEIVQRCMEPTNFLIKSQSGDFAISQFNYSEETKKLLDLILEILVDSGLLFVRQEFQEKYYQLVHDYVVKPIRNRFNLEERLQRAEAEIKKVEIAKNQAETDKIISQNQLNIVLKRQLTAAIVGIILMSFSTITTLGFWQKAIFQKEVAQAQRQLANAQKHRADINSMTALSEALYFSGYKFDALIESIKAGQKWQEIKQLSIENDLSKDTEYRIAASLQQAIYGVNEYNQLVGHSDVVWSVIFHPEKKLIASASADKTIKIWSKQGKLEKTLTDHTDKVSRISFSPNGQYLASASHDKTVKIWNFERLENKPISLKSHRDAVVTVNFSPNGQILASGSLDKTIKIWSQTGILLRTIKTKTIIQWVNFHPNGNIIVAANQNGTIQLWNLKGQLLTTIKHQDNNSNHAVYSANFSPDGKKLVTASRDKTIKIWNFSGNKLTLKKTITGHKEQIISAVFSPDGKTIASSSIDKTIKIWALDGTLLKTFLGHGDTVTQINFSPDNQTLVSASYDKSIKLWNLKNSSLNILKGHKHRILNVTFSADAQILASASQDNTIKLWSSTGKQLNTLRGHTDRVSSVSFSPDSQILASGSYDNTVKLWYFNTPQKNWRKESINEPQDWQSDHQNNQYYLENKKHQKNQHYNLEKKNNCFVRLSNFCLISLNTTIPFFPANLYSPSHQFSEEEKYSNLIEITVDTQLKTCSKTRCFPKSNYPPLPPLKKEETYPNLPLRNIDLVGHTDSVMSVAFSPDNQIIASGSKDKTVMLWNREGKWLKTLPGHKKWVSSVSFSPDGKILASASDDGTVKLWTNKGKLLRTINAHNSWILGVSFSPDGQAIATASYDNTVKLWSLDGKLQKTFLKGASDSVTSVSFSPDGQVLASSSYDGKVKLWSLNDGSLLKTLSGHQDSVMSVSFSPNSKLLASGSRDKTIILWDLALDDLLEKGCIWVDNYLRTNPHAFQSNGELCGNK